MGVKVKTEDLQLRHLEKNIASLPKLNNDQSNTGLFMINNNDLIPLKTTVNIIDMTKL